MYLYGFNPMEQGQKFSLIYTNKILPRIIIEINVRVAVGFSGSGLLFNFNTSPPVLKWLLQVWIVCNLSTINSRTKWNGENDKWIEKTNSTLCKHFRNRICLPHLPYSTLYTLFCVFYLALIRRYGYHIKTIEMESQLQNDLSKTWLE